jgi:hypothetical protein
LVELAIVHVEPGRGFDPRHNREEVLQRLRQRTG